MAPTLRAPVKKISSLSMVVPTINLTISRSSDGREWYATASMQIGPGKEHAIHVTSSISHQALLALWRKYKSNDATSGLFDSLSDMVSSIPGVSAVKGIVKAVSNAIPIKKLVGPVMKLAGKVSETAIRSAYSVASLARLGVKSALDKVNKLKSLALNNPIAAKALATIKGVVGFVPKLAVKVMNAGRLAAGAASSAQSGDFEGAVRQGGAAARELPAPLGDALATSIGGPPAVLALHAMRTLDEIRNSPAKAAPRGFTRALALVPPLMAVV